MKYLIGLLFALTLISCNKEIDDENPFKDTYFYQASCIIYNSLSDTMACLEYSTTFMSDTNTDCINQQTYYSSSGATSQNYSSGASAPACSLANLSGKCTKSNHRIFYYTTEFTAGQAQTECNTLGGTFQ